ncbi:MAG: carbohydrate-binding protein, partial [Cytophagales bacterium]|nr:carbohydrate-binding protein [Cytophaga sp.]
MIKRLFLFLPLLLAMSFSSTSQVSPKRGLAYGFTSIADINVLKPGISWWYNWSSIPDKGEVNDYYSTLGLEYVPMAWNGNIDVNAFISTIKPGAKYILGFNEPSLQVEANMTPQDAVNNWGKIEQIAAAKNLQIVSAAAIYSGAGSVGGYTNPVDWHKEFFRLCPNCWVDYIAFHSYEPSAGGVIGLTNNLKVFGRPIWVTEFANYNASVADNTSFMQQIVSAFENDPDIFRYSWFTGRRQGVPNIDILGANGVLTSLGTAYAGADYKQKMIAVPGRITANKHYRRNATALESTTDGGTGQSVGFTKVGSWGEYQLNVANTGSYNLNLRVASTTASNSVDIYVNGVFAQNKTFGTTNGWQTWADVLVSGITLPKGEVYLKLVYKSLFNLNYIDAIYGGGAIAIADFSATPNPTCVGNKVVFTNLTTAFAGDELYTWDFGQGASPATASATEIQPSPNLREQPKTGVAKVQIEEPSSAVENPQKLALRGAELAATASSNSFVTAAVDRVGRAVVRIDTERTVSRNLDPLMEDPFFNRFFREDLRTQVPRQERLRGQGSGFVIDKSGTVLTNAHVVDKA